MSLLGNSWGDGGGQWGCALWCIEGHLRVGELQQVQGKVQRELLPVELVPPEEAVQVLALLRSWGGATQEGLFYQDGKNSAPLLKPFYAVYQQVIKLVHLMRTGKCLFL